MTANEHKNRRVVVAAVAGGALVALCIAAWLGWTSYRARETMDNIYEGMTRGIIASCEKALQCKTEHPVFQGERLALLEEMKRKGMSPESGAWIVSAAVIERLRDDAIFLHVDAVGPMARQDRGVVVFSDHEGRTVQIVCSLLPSVSLATTPGFLRRVEFVSLTELMPLARKDELGVLTLHEADLKKAFPRLHGRLPLPKETPMAAGLRYPNGRYTTFVPVVSKRHPPE